MMNSIPHSPIHPFTRLHSPVSRSPLPLYNDPRIRISGGNAQSIWYVLAVTDTLLAGVAAAGKFNRYLRESPMARTGHRRWRDRARALFRIAAAQHHSCKARPKGIRVLFVAADKDADPIGAS